jgi:hypothetical protein
MVARTTFTVNKINILTKEEIIDMKKYQRLAQCYNAWENCLLTNNTEWQQRWEEEISSIINSLPHGSGIDGRTEFSYDRSRKDTKLIIDSEYHALNDNGYYDGWYNFRVVITASLQFGAEITIKGVLGRYDYCKDYLQNVFYDSFMEEYLDHS